MKNVRNVLFFVFLNFAHLSTDSTVEGLFNISRKDGVISISSAIDREVTNDVVRLTVKVPVLFGLFFDTFSTHLLACF